MLKRLLSASVLLAAIPALSQGGPGGPGMEHGPVGFGGAMRAPVTNAPYSATFTSSSSEKLQDGTILNHSSNRMVARDSLGRTREEVTLPPRGGAEASAKPRTMIVLLDPVAHTVTQLRTEQKVAIVHAMRQPGEAARHHGPGRLNGAPASGPDGSAEPGTQADHSFGPHKDRNVVRTDLGAKTISGIVSNGTRVTRTIPVGEIGNAALVISTHEEWFSPDLKIELSRTDVDPFYGTRTTTVSALSKAEPAASMFQVPEGYTIRQASDHAFDRRGAGIPRHAGDAPPRSAEGVSPAPVF